jgi:hypothetical protein
VAHFAGDPAVGAEEPLPHTRLLVERQHLPTALRGRAYKHVASCYCRRAPHRVTYLPNDHLCQPNTFYFVLCIHSNTSLARPTSLALLHSYYTHGRRRRLRRGRWRHTSAFHLSTPVVAYSAYSFPSALPTNTVSLDAAGELSTSAPVAYRHRSLPVLSYSQS